MKTKPITITVNNIKAERGGQIIAFVFLQQGYPKIHSQALMKFITSVDQQNTNINIQVPVQQEFALKILHDENKDGKVTKNWTGILPHDGIGFSNGAKLRFGVPSFESSSIRYTENLAPVITLQYF